MLGLKRVHHIAIIATDYAKSKAFYCDILGFTLQGEFYRQERDSWKGDLALNGEYVIELFSFPFPPARRAAPKPAGCAIWRLALMMSMLPLRILRPTAWPVKAFVSTPSPVNDSPFLTIRTGYRWRFISSNSCQGVFCRVTCRTRFPQLILS